MTADNYNPDEDPRFSHVVAKLNNDPIFSEKVKLTELVSNIIGIHAQVGAQGLVEGNLDATPFVTIDKLVFTLSLVNKVLVRELIAAAVADAVIPTPTDADFDGLLG